MATKYINGKLKCFPYRRCEIIGKICFNYGTIDIYINASKGQVIYAVSGIDNNPTRFPKVDAAFDISEETCWLPRSLYKCFVTENNPTLELV